MIRRRKEMGGREEGVVEAVGGGGLGSESVKVGEDTKGKGRISLDHAITCLSISLSQTHLITGTASGEIHIHALPSHQHTRTILTHVGSPISHISTMLRPPDLIGHISLTAAMHGGLNKDGWPVMEVRPLERMRVGQRQRLEQEIGVMLGGKVDEEIMDGFDIVESELPASVGTASVAEVKDDGDDSSRLLELEAEVARLRSQLARAKQINDRIWSGVVDQVFVGKSRKGVANGGDVNMEA